MQEYREVARTWKFKMGQGPYEETSKWSTAMRIC